jgi:hypothetical protein
VYDAPAGLCPTRERVEALIVARLGFDPFCSACDPSQRPSEVRPVVRIAVTADEAENARPTPRSGQRSGTSSTTTATRALRAVVERRDGDAPGGARRLREPSGDCNELVASAALAASIVIDPTGELARAAEDGSGPVSPSPRNSAPGVDGAAKGNASTGSPPPTEREEDPFADEADAGRDEAPPNAASVPLVWFAGARGLVSVGLLPKPSPGVVVEGGVRRGPLVVRVEGRGDLPVASDPVSGVRARASYLGGALVPCYAFSRLALCAVASFGRVVAESEGVTPAQQGGAFFVGVGLRPILEVPIATPVRLVLTAEGLLALTKTRLVVRGEEVWSSSAVSATLGAGLAVDFR